MECESYCYIILKNHTIVDCSIVLLPYISLKEPHNWKMVTLLEWYPALFCTAQGSVYKMLSCLLFSPRHPWGGGGVGRCERLTKSHPSSTDLCVLELTNTQFLVWHFLNFMRPPPLAISVNMKARRKSPLYLFKYILINSL